MVKTNFPDFADIIKINDNLIAVVLYLDYSKKESLIKYFSNKEEAILYINNRVYSD